MLTWKVACLYLIRNTELCRNNRMSYYEEQEVVNNDVFNAEVNLLKYELFFTET